IKNCPLNIDLQNQSVEINTDKGIRVLPSNQIKSLSVGIENLNRQHFINAKNINGNQAQIAGLVELMVKDDVTLVKYPFLYVKEGNYNAALDMGNDEVKYLVTNKFFLFDNGKLIEIPTSRKKFLSIFPPNNQSK